jgi:D-alanyl-D-alanine carboxypeptidase
MNNYFAKFTFLVAVVGAILFSRMAYPSTPLANLAGANGANNKGLNKEVPFFILPPVAVSAGGDTASVTTTGRSVPVAPPRAGSAAVVPTLHAAASIVADLGNGTVFEAMNVDKRWPTASITKLMTATIVVDKLDPTTKITLTQEMFASDPAEATLMVGETYTVADLLRAMLLPSSNVAAEALAAFYGRDKFLAEMNARATEWGMKDTYFGDPSGISAGTQSTATDLLKLAEKIYSDYRKIFEITRTTQVSITEQSSGVKTVIKSINNFAGTADFIGGKTGYTSEADGNLLSVFGYQGRPIAVIVLGTDNRFPDTQTLYDWFKHAY